MNKNILRGGPLYIAVFLTSISVMVLEIALTRIFSVIFAYHFAFMVVSLALFGLGLGGYVVFYASTKWPRIEEFILPVATTLFSLFSAAVVLLIIRLPESASLEFYFVLAFAPFLFAGAFFSIAFRQRPEKAGTLYFADLLGAGLGSLAFLFFIARFGAVNTAMLGALFAMAAAILLIFSSRIKKTILLATLTLAGLLIGISLTNKFSQTIPIAKNIDKDLYRLMQTPGNALGIVDSRWSSFGRTDLLADKNDALSMSLFVDGAAGTPMYRFNGDISDSSNASLKHLMHFSGFFPLLFLNNDQKDDALSIGAGGGRDVLLLRLAGIKNITAVEVNSDLVKLVQEYADFNGGIYNNMPGVNVEIAEGRQFVKRSQIKYDVLFASLPISKTGGNLNNYALNENTLFTREAILDYYDHLTEEGQVVIVAHHMPEIYKLVFTSIKALEERGLDASRVMQRILTTGPQMMPVFVLKKQPFTQQESDILHDAVHEAGFESQTMFIPNIKQAFYRPLDDTTPLQKLAMLNNILYALATNSIQLDAVLSKMAMDLNPPTDDSPFFYKMELGLPQPLPLLGWLSLSVLAVLLYFPYQNLKYKSAKDKKNGMSAAAVRNLVPYMALFLFIGVGYMMVELTLIQRFTFYLGRPAVTLSLLLAVLLGASGLGSLLSGALFPRASRSLVRKSALAVSIIVLLYLVLLPSLLELTIAATLPIRILTAVASIFVIGVFLGVPFPSAIRVMQNEGLGAVIPWMWGINGAASVFGALVTVMLAIKFGYTWVFISAALLYLALFVLFFKLKLKS